MQIKPILGLCLTAALALGTAHTALAQSAEGREGRETMLKAYATADQNGDNILTIAEVAEMSENIFVSMDYNDDGKITKPEFMDWDVGVVFAAQKNDKLVEFVTAKKIFFALRDLNNDGAIDAIEQRKASLTDFDRADLNGDAKLNKDEFLSGYIPSMVFKAALAPEN